MTSRSSLAFLTVFAATFAVAYLVVMEMNLAAFTYHPRPGEWGLGVEPPRNGPAMYWYGWLTTATAIALVAAAAALAVARPVPAKLWLPLGWLVPAGAMIAAVYLMSPFFLR